MQTQCQTPTLFRAIIKRSSDLKSCRAFPCPDSASCTLICLFRCHFVHPLPRFPTRFRAGDMPKADFISCRAIPSFRLDLVQAPFRFPIYFRASSVSGPSHPMRTARRLVSFRTQNRPDMQHFVFVRDRKASGLVMNVPAAESGPPDALPQKNSHETCPKPLDSRSVPPD